MRVEWLVAHSSTVPAAWQVACLRNVSILFINLGVGGDNLSFNSATILATCQELFNTICAIVFENEGSIRQFIMDDKGTVMIGVFGLPPLAHANDPVCLFLRDCCRLFLRCLSEFVLDRRLVPYVLRYKLGTNWRR